MENIVLEFFAKYKHMGEIASKVTAYEERVVIERTISGVLKATYLLPTSTAVYFKDITGCFHKEPTFMSANIGWIELSGNNRSATVGTVDANRIANNAISNINAEINYAIKNPYCIVYNKDEKKMKENFERLYNVFLASKDRNLSAQPEQSVSAESPLDKIKKLKELLEMGAITQQEFDEKRVKLLSQI